MNDYFQTTLFTGDGAGTKSISGIDLSAGGASWFKSRSATQDHGFMYSTTGASPQVMGIATATLASAAAASFVSGGTDLTNATYNVNARTYANWTFKKSARFFDVVTYAGNATNRTIAHSLGVIPGLIMIKRTDSNFPGGWVCYHNSLGNGSGIDLIGGTSSAIATYWNSTSPTSSVFSLGTNNNVNGSGRSFVAIVFANDAASDGIIKSFTYTGNSGSVGPEVNLGWHPQFLLLIPNAGVDRRIFDTTRTPSFTGNDAVIFPNLDVAETSSTNAIQWSTNGFEAVGTASDTNTNGRVYYGLAIRTP